MYDGDARVEQDAREAASVSRNQNVVHVIPHDWASVTHVLGPVLERVDASHGELQVLVITADARAYPRSASCTVSWTATATRSPCGGRGKFEPANLSTDGACAGTIRGEPI